MHCLCTCSPEQAQVTPETATQGLLLVRNFFLVIIASSCSARAAARAHDVLVIQGLRVKPFDEAYRGFRNACAADARRVYLSDLESTDILRMVREEKPRLIIAIGADALARVQKVKNVPILYLMVLNPHSALHGNRNVTGVDHERPAGKVLSVPGAHLPRPEEDRPRLRPGKNGRPRQRGHSRRQKRRGWSSCHWRSPGQTTCPLPSTP